MTDAEQAARVHADVLTWLGELSWPVELRENAATQCAPFYRYDAATGRTVVQAKIDASRRITVLDAPRLMFDILGSGQALPYDPVRFIRELAWALPHLAWRGLQVLTPPAV